MKLRFHKESLSPQYYVWKEIDETKYAKLGLLCSIKQEGDTVILSYQNGRLLLTFPREGIIRLRLDGAAVLYPSYPHDISVLDNIRETTNTPNIQDNGKGIKIEFGSILLEAEYGKAGFIILRNNLETLAVCEEIAVNDASVIAYFKNTEADNFFGFGGKTGHISRKKRTVDCFSVKQQLKNGDFGGFAMPMFLNPAGYLFVLDNPYPHVYFDCGYQNPEQWFAYTPDGGFDAYFGEGEDFSALIKKYFYLTGKPALPAKWMFGFWISWCGKCTGADWRQFVKRFSDENWPIDVAVLDLYWRGGKTDSDAEGRAGVNLEWDEKGFDTHEIMDFFKSLGVKTCLHVNTKMYSGAVKETGLKEGHLLEARGGQIVANVFSEAGEKFNSELYRPRIEEGADCFWTDNGERVDTIIKNGLPARNIYGKLWDAMIYNVMDSIGKKNRPVLSRGGFLGSQKYSLPWPGDTGTGVDRLREDMVFCQNLALSGVPYSGADLGGFFEKSGENLMHGDENVIRRIIHGLIYFAIPRAHNGTGDPKFPYLYSEKIQGLYREFLNLRYSLTPYIYSNAAQTAESGAPPFRPVVFDHPTDRIAWGIEDEIMLGGDILIAPVTKVWAYDREVWLPSGGFYDFFTKEYIEGGRMIYADAPLYCANGLPMFIKEGAIIPRIKPRSHIGDEPWGDIILEIYPAKGTKEFKLYEDEEVYSLIKASYGEENIEISLQNNSDKKREYEILFPAHDSIQSKKVIVKSGHTEVVLCER